MGDFDSSHNGLLFEHKQRIHMHAMLNTAIKAARRAGQIINRASLDLDGIQVSEKQRNDFVTNVDRACEAAIIEILQAAYPQHAILAEEPGRSAQSSDHVWIIDPLDGTTNFIHGFPYYCVSIALMQRGIVTQAVIYDPPRNDLYTASRGRGAFLNNRRLRVSSRAKLAEALLGVGFCDPKNLNGYLALYSRINALCTSVRRSGAAALDLANVAAGRLDGFFEQGMYPWDMAAGGLLITEAGGLAGNYTGEPDFLERGEIVAANPKLYAQMVTVLKPHSGAPHKTNQNV